MSRTRLAFVLCAGLAASSCSSRPTAVSALADGEIALEDALRAGADVDALDANGYGPIHIAAIRGDHRLLEVLLDHHAKVEALNVKGETPLFLAAALGHADCVYLLLASGAKPNVQVGLNETTPLLEVAAKGPIEILQLLLDAGADPNLANSWGETPLHVVAKVDWLRAGASARLLVGHGANLLARDLRGYTPLHFAGVTNNLALIRLYAEMKMDLSVPDVVGSTPLDVAMGADSDVAADLLFRLGARPATTVDFVPPLHRAARVDDFDQAQRLLGLGADPQETFDGQTALEVARLHRSAAVTGLLERSLAGPRFSPPP